MSSRTIASLAEGRSNKQIAAELHLSEGTVRNYLSTAFGKLGSRVDPQAAGSYWELANDDQPDSFAAVCSRVGDKRYLTCPVPSAAVAG